VTNLEDAGAILKRYSLEERSAYLRKFRRREGLSLSDIASLAGLNKSTLSRYERGLTDLKVETYSRLEDAFDEIAKAHAIVERYVERVEKTRKEKPDWDEVVGRLASPWSRLVPPQDRKALKKWISDSVRHRIRRHKDMKIVELAAEIGALKKRLAFLEDLLNLETAAAVSKSEADEVRAILTWRKE